LCNDGSHVYPTLCILKLRRGEELRRSHVQRGGSSSITSSRSPGKRGTSHSGAGQTLTAATGVETTTRIAGTSTPPRLVKRRRGFCRVIKFPSPNIVSLQIPGSRRCRTASLRNLKPYHQDEDDDDHDRDHESERVGETANNQDDHHSRAPSEETRVSWGSLADERTRPASPPPHWGSRPPGRLSSTRAQSPKIQHPLKLTPGRPRNTGDEAGSRSPHDKHPESTHVIHSPQLKIRLSRVHFKIH